ncbi:MAG: hypothetical protein ACXVAA_13200, partial [Candidatus Binataceae bacterium]
ARLFRAVSVRLLKNDIDRHGIVTKVSVLRKGIRSGGRCFSRGALPAVGEGSAASAQSRNSAGISRDLEKGRIRAPRQGEWSALKDEPSPIRLRESIITDSRVPAQGLSITCVENF